MRHEFLKGLLGKQYVTPMQGILGGMGEGVAALPRGASWGSLIGAMGGGIARGRQSAQMQNYAQMQMMAVQNKYLASQKARAQAKETARHMESLAKGFDDDYPKRAAAIRAGIVPDWKTMFPPPTKAGSAIGKLQADLAADRITQKQYEIGVAKIQRGGVTVIVGGKGGVIERMADDTYEDAMGAAARASENLFRLGEWKSLVDTGVPTGKMQDMSIGIRGILRDFGVVDNSLSIQEAINSLGDEMALSKHEPGMGPMTDPDFQIYRGIMPSLKGSVTGNALITRRLEREYRGKQLYFEIIKEQIISDKSGANVNPAKAWAETRKRLDNELGPIIPTFKTRAEFDRVAEQYIGQIVAVEGKGFRVGWKPDQ